MTTVEPVAAAGAGPGVSGAAGALPAGVDPPPAEGPVAALGPAAAFGPAALPPVEGRAEPVPPAVAAPAPAVPTGAPEAATGAVPLAAAAVAAADPESPPLTGWPTRPPTGP